MKKYKYNINNLDCANCARKVEESLNKNKDFKNVIVNFNTKKLSYESDKKFTINELNKLVKSIEPDASISKDVVEEKKEFHAWVLILATILGIIACYSKLNKNVKLVLYIISYALLLYRTFINSIKLLFKSKTINENLLITVSCIGAFIIGERMEGLMVIILYTIGKILEEKALNNSRKSIQDLMDLKEPFANLKTSKSSKKISVEEIKVGDLLIVKKGEKIPVDGIIYEGESLLDTSLLTGESEPVKVKKGDKCLSGSINTSDVIIIKATSLFEDSTVSKILELLESATDKKTKTETIVSKISKVYTPIVLILAILVAILLPAISSVTRSDAIYRALTFLVISCPCAIAISVPLSYFTGIGVCSKNGILIKGSNYLDNLTNLNNIIFDKTGTLTNGSFEVTEINIIDEDENDEYNKDKILEILLKGENLSNHPLAKSILKLTDKEIDSSEVKNFKEISGKGITFTLNKKHVSIGNKTLCNCGYDALLHLNIDGKHIASITINDGIKEHAVETIMLLKANNIKTYMFTGDKKDVALTIGKRLGIDKIKYEMLPTDKFKEYESVAKTNEITAFVGDGVNDAPVLKRADIGISMGGVGSESAIEASDIVLMSDDLDKIPLMINISKYTRKIIKENLIFAILVKIIILVLSVLGKSNMWMAVFADTGLTLLTILNTLRIIRRYR